MKQSWRSLFFLTLPLATLGSLAPLTTVRAQIAPDNTLGAENSVVTPNQVINGTPSDRIDGGATRGANLFHSFREFNINEGRGAYFSNPAVIENIFSRVTGGNPSNILGRLGVLGNANLFFINPNGIIFGPSSRLDLNGSFLGSTANSLIFDNGFRFSASNPQAPPLLTVNIPIGLRFRDNPSGITVRGSGQDLGLDGAFTSFDNPTLEVPVGQNLSLVGGNVSLDGGVLQAPGGRVELGGLAAAGTVGLNNGSLSFPDSVARADVSLTNRAGINVIADAFGGGSIDINARNLGISGESLLTAGLTSNLGEIDTFGGDITLTATGETRIERSRIENNVNEETIANNSNINIQTGSFVLTNEAELSASNLDSSESRVAGDVRVDASGAITVDGGAAISSEGFYGRVFLTSSNNSVNINNASIKTESDNGNTDDNRFNLIEISALQGSVFLNNAEIDNTNSGTGYAGDIRINARDQISITNSQIFAQGNQGRILIGDAQSFAPGFLRIDGADTELRIDNRIAPDTDAGSIKLAAGNVVINQATLTSSTYGSGKAGDITVDASGSVEFVDNALFSNVGAGATGQAGNITIKAGSLSLLNGAQLQSSVSEPPDDNPQGQGGQGIGVSNVTIDVQGNVTIAGSNSDGKSSAIFTDVESGASGDAGNITITSQAGSVFLDNGGELFSSNKSTGLAGDIVLNARDQVSLANNSTIKSEGNFGRIFIGKSEISRETSSPRVVSLDGSTISTTNSGVTDAADEEINAGEISIDAIDSISLVNGSEIISSTQRLGNAGNISLATSGSVEFKQSTLFSNVNAGATGQAGNITINAGSLSLLEGAQLQSGVNRPSDDNSQGGRRSGIGNVTIDVQGNVTIAGRNPETGRPSAIFTDVEEKASGNASNITITSQAGSILLDNGAQLYSKNASTGFAGDITLNARDGKIEIVGSEITSTSNNANTNPNLYSLIDIAAPQGSISLNQATISTTNFGTGYAGDVVLNARDKVTANQSTIKSDGLYGRIFIGRNNETSSPRVVSLDGSILSTTNESVEDAEDTAINAGDISIDAINISLVNKSEINAFTARRGNAGSVTLRAENGEISLAEGSRIFSGVEAEGVGDGGNITLNSRDLILRDNSDITTNATVSGTGGNITIDADFLIAYPDKEDGSDITANANEGEGGAINITANRVFGIQKRDKLTENNDITAFSQVDPSLNGNISLNTPDVDPSRGLVELPENVVDPAAQIAQNPCQQGVGSQFIVTGRGGLPPNPNQALSSDNVLVDLVEPVLGGSREQGAGSREQGAGSREQGAGSREQGAGSREQRGRGAEEKTGSIASVPKPVVPAQGWVFNEKGEVVLTAYDPTGTGTQRPWQTPSSCAVRASNGMLNHVTGKPTVNLGTSSR